MALIGRYAVSKPFHGESRTFWYAYDTVEGYAVESASSEQKAQAIADALNSVFAKSPEFAQQLKEKAAEAKADDALGPGVAPR